MAGHTASIVYNEGHKPRNELVVFHLKPATSQIISIGAMMRQFAFEPVPVISSVHTFLHKTARPHLPALLLPHLLHTSVQGRLGQHPCEPFAAALPPLLTSADDVK
jgi:hypothetical protein